MSDSGNSPSPANAPAPQSLSDAFGYTREGYSPQDQARKGIESGVAQPAAAVESRTAVDGARVQSGQPPSQTGALGISNNPSPDPKETATRPPTEGAEGVPAGADPALWNEFTEAATELKLDKAGTDRLVALHQRAIQSQYEHHDRTIADWRTQTEQAYTPAQLNAVLTEFRSRVGDDADARAFKRMLNLTGMGNHVSAVRIFERLMKGR